jgi:cytochrome P450
MKGYSLPPGPRALPFVGNTLSYRKDRLGFLTGLYNDYGPISTFHLGEIPVVLVTRPGTVREILVDKIAKFPKGGYIQNFALFGGETLVTRHALTPKAKVARCCGCGQEKSIFSTDGEIHDRQRTAMLEAFHGPALERYREIMVAHTERMLDEWQDGQEIELTHEVQRVASSIIFETLFGVDLQDRSAAIAESYRSVLKHSSLFSLFKSSSESNKEQAWSGLMTLVEEIVEKAASRKADSNSTLLIDMILRSAPAGRANEMVRDQVVSFMGAGQVTVSGLLTWAITLLAKHPPVMEKVREEVQTILCGSAPSITDMPKLTYLDWVIKESLRLYPPAWLHGRQSAEDVELEGWNLPAGTFVLFTEWVTQRAEEYFADPLRYKPERFGPKPPYRHTPDAYFPFGMGMRACLGTGFAVLEAKIVLSLMLQRFAPVVVDDRQLEPTVYYSALRPRGTVTIRMESVPTVQPDEMPVTA